MARNAFHLVLGQVFSTALGVLLSAALARRLGVADFGLFFLVTSMATFAFVVVEWGQTLYVIREVARRPERSGQLLGSTLVLRVIGSLAAAVITALIAAVLGYPLRTCLLAGLQVLTMLPFFLAQAFGLIFRGKERMGRDALVSVLNKGLLLGSTVALLYLGAGTLGAVAAPALAGVVALLVAGLLLRRLDVPVLQPSWAVSRELMREGAPLLVFMVAIASQGYIDAVVLSKLAPAEAVGWFGAAKNIFGTLMAPAAILASAAYPRLSRTVRDPSLFSVELRAALRPLLGFAVLVAVGTHLFAGQAVALVYGGQKYAPAATILQVFAPGFFLVFVDTLLGAATLAAGKNRALAALKLGNAALTTVLGVIFVPICQARYGNGGLAIAGVFGASEITMFVSLVVLLPRHALAPALLSDLGRALLAGASTFVLFSLLPPLSLFLGGPLCVLAFAVFALAFGLVRLEELTHFRRSVLQGSDSVSGEAAAPIP